MRSGLVQAVLLTSHTPCCLPTARAGRLPGGGGREAGRGADTRCALCLRRLPAHLLEQVSRILTSRDKLTQELGRPPSMLVRPGLHAALQRFQAGAT